MKKVCKRLASVFMIIALCLALFPSAALATETPVLKVADLEITDSNASDIAGALENMATTVGEGSKIDYDFDTKTLTLDNADIDIYGENFGIFCNHDLIIALKGHNYFHWSSGAGDDTCAGIYVNGNLTIKKADGAESGSLTVIASGSNYNWVDYSTPEYASCGIRFENGILTIEEGATVTAKGGKAPDAGSYGVYSSGIGANLVVNGTLHSVSDDACWTHGVYIFTNNVTVGANGALTAMSGESNAATNSGILCQTLTLSGGKVDATAGGCAEENTYYTQSVGILCNDITVTGGELTATGGEASYGSGQHSEGIWAQQGVNVTGGTVTATGGKAYESTGIYADCLTVDNNAKVTANGGEGTGNGNSYGIYIVNDMTVRNAEVIATGDKAYSSSYGIDVDKNLTIEGESKVTATGGEAGNNSSYGIIATDDLTIAGKSVVTANGGKANIDSCGIKAYAGMTIEGEPVVTANGEAAQISFGVMTNGLSVSGGELEATGGTATGYSVGIQNRGALTVPGGKVTAIGGTAECSCGIEGEDDPNPWSISGDAEVTAIGGEATSDESTGFRNNSEHTGTIVSDSAKLTATGGKAENGSSYGYNGLLGILNNASVTADGGEAKGGEGEDQSYGVYGRIIAVQGGKLTATGNFAGIFSKANDPGISITDGEAIANGGNVGVFGKLAISGGKLTAAGTADPVSFGAYVPNTCSLTINGGVAEFTGKKQAVYGNGSVVLADAMAAAGGASSGELTLASATDLNNDIIGYKYVKTAPAVTVSFNANDGSGTMAPVKFLKDTAFKLPANGFTAPNDKPYFGNWNTLADNNGTSYADKDTVTLSADTELYAQWTAAVKYAITVVDGMRNPVTAAEGTLVTVTANSAPEGQRFKEWTSSDGVQFADKNAEETSFTMPAKDVTVTAVFEDIPKYTVTVNGGTLASGATSGEYAEGVTVEIHAGEPASGMVFDRWTAENNDVSFNSATASDTTFTMPAHAVSVKANYKSEGTGTGGTGGGSTGGGSTGGSSKKDDSSKTTTVTNPDGSVTKTTTNADGSKTAVTTAQDGSAATVKTDKDGKVVSVEATVSEKAVAEAAKSGESVKLQAEVKAAATADAAAPITVALPKTDKPVKVEIPVENVTASTVAVIVRADGTEEIVKTSTTDGDGVVLSLDGGATLKVFDNAKSFGDVKSDDWFAGSVAWAASHEVMNGVGGGSFSPNATTSRGMIAQLLFNLDGAVASGDTAAFSDVSADDWFAGAVTWMVDAGIAQGRGDSFGANDAVSREQLAVMLYNYAKFKGYDVSAQGDVSAFSDADSVSDYAKDTIAWAVGTGLINGMGDGSVAPQGSATRAQVAAIVQRFCDKVAM